MIKGTISADIVSSSYLSVDEKDRLNSNIRIFLKELENDKTQTNWGRIVKGDAIEIYMSSPKIALKTALRLKTLVKMTPLDLFPKSNEDNITPEIQRRRDLYQKYGVRLAIGVGKMDVADKEKDILDGEAIYFSGRLMEHQSTSQKERAVVKNTLFFKAHNDSLTIQMSVILGLLDVLLKKANTRQCEVLYYKLSGKSELEIADKLNIRQSAVNQHSTAAGWNAIEQAVLYYENINFEDYA